jgi:hypothetical protein
MPNQAHLVATNPGSINPDFQAFFVDALKREEQLSGEWVAYGAAVAQPVSGPAQSRPLLLPSALSAHRLDPLGTATAPSLRLADNSAQKTAGISHLG